MGGALHDMGIDLAPPRSLKGPRGLRQGLDRHDIVAVAMD
jgi:hypothetical protein